ncbi:MAG: N-acetylneuraminate synthase family protein [Syntrophobacteraceae bacterium]
MGKPLFVFEMANNHMGSLDHGVRIIREFGEIVKGFPFQFAFKLQYRDLDTFIHPDFKERMDIKYVKRFMETRIEEEVFILFLQEMKACGFITMCTPFDEPSVDKIEKQGIDIVKIASCSFTDWPLLERIAQTKKPIIASTASASLDEIDNVVSFFEHRNKDFTLMHCVAEYPTADDNLQLNQIDLLRGRYPKVRIGYSTHEGPNNVDAIRIAVAKGAAVFEKHVGVPTEQFALNGYSASPAQAKAWLNAAAQSYRMSGVAGIRVKPSEKELDSITSLRRGVFASRSFAKGEAIGQNEVFMAFPPQDGQVTANEWSKYTRFVATSDIEAKAPLLATNMNCYHMRQKVFDIVQRVKGLLEEGRIVVPGQTDLEVSHHYGLDRFDEHGLVMITVVNREYCKKILVMLPGQSHPEQFHEKKEETFHVLHGSVKVALDGEEKTYGPGESIHVDRGVRHKMCTVTGTVFEEISSTHYKDDSFYVDPAISRNRDRKTYLTYALR